LAVPTTSQPETALLAEIGASSWMPGSTVGTPLTTVRMSWPIVALPVVWSTRATLAWPMQVLVVSHVRRISPSSDMVVEYRVLGAVTSSTVSVAPSPPSTWCHCESFEKTCSLVPLSWVPQMITWPTWS
jgi:hypothetical protein